MAKIPYKIYLEEEEMPKQWHNVRPYMKEKPEPFINPATGKPCTADDLRPVFCDELIDQELNVTDKMCIRDRCKGSPHISDHLLCF